MSFNFPNNRKEVANTIKSSYKAEKQEANPFLRLSFIKSLIIAFSGRIFDFYEKLKFLTKQSFLIDAEDEYVTKFGKIYNVQQKPAQPSSGFITFTGNSGGNVPSGSKLTSEDGNFYTVISGGNITTQVVAIDSMIRSGNTVTVNFNTNHNLSSGVIIDSITGATPGDFNVSNVSIIVTSESSFQFSQVGSNGSASTPGDATWTTLTSSVQSDDVGIVTNQDSGAVLTLTSPLANVNNNAIVQFTELTGGLDLQSFDSYKNDILFKIQNPASYFNKTSIINKVSETIGVDIANTFVFSPDSTSASAQITSITRTGNYAFVTTSSPHGLANGSRVTITGANQAEYNISNSAIIVSSATEFVYVVTGSPTTPATGSISLSYSFVLPGQVRVYFTKLSTLPVTATLVDTAIIPSSSDVNLVKNNLLKIKPAHIFTDDLIVSSPLALQVDFTISGLTPNSDSMKRAIINNLVDFFRNEAEVGKQINLDTLNGVIENSIDESGNSPSATLTSPSNNITPTNQELPIKGIITFV